MPPSIAQITEFQRPTRLPTIPDDLSVPQFLLDYHHPQRPLRPKNAPWLIDDNTGRSVGFEEIRARTYGLANIMKSRWNIGENNVVGIISSNHIDFPIIIWAAHRLGAAVTTANPAFSVDELVYQMTTVKASLLFAHASVFDTAKAAARSSGISEDRVILINPLTLSGPSTGPLEDAISQGLSLDRCFVERKFNPGEAKTKIAFYSFSSGTTGKPKAVAIPHYSVVACVLQWAAMFRINDPSVPVEINRWMPGEVSINVLPLFHIYGLLTNIHMMAFCGCSVVVVPKFDFKGMLRSIMKYRINNLILVPPMILLLCKSPEVQDYDLSSVRSILTGAAPLSGELTEQASRLLPSSSVFQGYGLTETTSGVTVGPLTQKVGIPGSAGQLLPGVVMKVMTPDGTYGTFGEEGELVIKSPSNALGYSNDEKSTRETFIDGWVRTGDKGYVTEELELFIIDRLKEIMKVRGFQVAPAELESHIIAHAWVSDVCVVGVPDDYSGELPLAFVVPSAEAVELIKQGKEGIAKVKAAIAKHVSDAKAPYKRLAGGIEFIDAIPKNPSGKLLRKLLRDKAKEARTRIVAENQKTDAKL